MVTGSKAWMGVRRVVDVAIAAGLERRALLARLGVRRGGDDVRVPIGRLFDLWTHVAHAVRDPALPVRAGAPASLEQLHLMGLAILTAPTGHEALERACRYTPLLTDTGRWEHARAGDTATVRWVRAGERSLGHRLANEGALVQFVACMRQVCGAGFAPTRVRFRHAAPRAALEAHRRFFRAPVELDADGDGFDFPARALDVVPAAHNPAIAAFVRGHAEERLRAAAASTRAAAYAAIVRDPSRGAAEIALALGLGERTLRRRLRDEGTSLRALVDEARRERARALVATSVRPLTEIALEVGFSDSSAFSHAFRRWFGRAPRELRAGGNVRGL
jgi:AraC-like DNA-binding protein